MLYTISLPSKFWLTAIVLNITIKTIANISSNIKILRTKPANRCCLNPKSSKAL